METPTHFIKELYIHGKAYSKATFTLAKLKGIETTTDVLTELTWRLVVIVVLSLSLLVLNIGVALWLGELLGKSYYGFFIVATFYFIAAILFYFFLHRWIKKPVSDLIIKQALQ